MRYTLWRRYASEEAALFESAESVDSTESTAVGLVRASSPPLMFPLAFACSKPPPLASKPSPLRPPPARPLASAIEESSCSEDESDDGDPVVAPWESERWAARYGSFAQNTENDVVLPRQSQTLRGQNDEKPTRKKKKKKKKKQTKRTLTPPPPPSAASIARSARSLSARARSAAQSVADMKERLFFDDDEASARQGEFDEVCTLLDDAADVVDDGEALGTERLGAIRDAMAALERLWALTDDLEDRVAERCRSIPGIREDLLDPRAGFAAPPAKCCVRRVGMDGEAALRGQNECVARQFIEKGETAPYPGVVVASLSEQTALLAPLRPIDRVKWSCFSYSFSSLHENHDTVTAAMSGTEASSSPADQGNASSSSDTNPSPNEKKKYHRDETFCPELWPVLEGALMTYVNDACGPENRTAPRLAERQNVEYVETFVDPADPATWRVDVRAVRDVPGGEVLLSDYGQEYWANWKEHIHTRAMKRLDQRLNDLFAPAVARDGKNRKRVRVETRCHQWLRLAEAFDRNHRGLPPVIEQDYVTESSSSSSDDSESDDDAFFSRRTSSSAAPVPRAKKWPPPPPPPPKIVTAVSLSSSSSNAAAARKPTAAKKPKARASSAAAAAARKKSSDAAAATPPTKKKRARSVAAKNDSSSSKKKTKTTPTTTPPPQKPRTPPPSASTVATLPPKPPRSDSPPAKKRKRWQEYLGKRVSYFERVRGYRSTPATAVRLAVEATSRDPSVEALYDRARETTPLFEAWWDDGQPYPLRSVSGNGPFTVQFVDGETASVERVVPILAPAAWATLARLPLGAWCRPRGPPTKRNWGVVVSYAQNADGAYVYGVKNDTTGRVDHFHDDLLEPILIVRGNADESGQWQEAAPLSQLLVLPDD